MANKDSTLIPRAVRKGRSRRGSKRDKSASEYGSIPTDDLKLAAPPVEEPRQLAFWRQRDPRRARQRNAHALYVCKGAFAVFDIHVLDHLLVGKSIISFVEFGLL